MMSYVHIEVPSMRGVVTEIQCFEDHFGGGIGDLKQDGSLVLHHYWGEVELISHLIPEPGALLFKVSIRAATKEQAWKVATIAPCWQFTKTKGVGDGRLIEDFVNHCFIYTVSGFTFLKDTIRFEDKTYIPNKVPLPDDDPEKLRPHAQVYVPVTSLFTGREGAGWGLSTDRPIYSLIGFVSLDGKHLAAWGWSRSWDLQQGLAHCLHTNPDWGHDYQEKDGEFTFQGKLYFMDNDPDKLLKMYLNDFPQDWQTELSLKGNGKNVLEVTHADRSREPLLLCVGAQLSSREVLKSAAIWSEHPWGTFTREGRTTDGRCMVWARPSGDFVELYVTVSNDTETAVDATVTASVSGAGWAPASNDNWIADFIWEQKSHTLAVGEQITFRGRLFLFQVEDTRTWFQEVVTAALDRLMDRPESPVMKDRREMKLKEKKDAALLEWRSARPFKIPLP